MLFSRRRKSCVLRGFWKSCDHPGISCDRTPILWLSFWYDITVRYGTVQRLRYLRYFFLTSSNEGTELLIGIGWHENPGMPSIKESTLLLLEHALRPGRLRISWEQWKLLVEFFFCVDIMVRIGNTLFSQLATKRKTRKLFGTIGNIHRREPWIVIMITRTRDSYGCLVKH